MAKTSVADDRQEKNADWMGSLPRHLRHAPLYTLAIPGSHDSGTFDLSSWRGVGSDIGSRTLRMVLSVFTYLCCCLSVNFLKKWSKCQAMNFRDQLGLGVRFFDLRVARCKKTRLGKSSQGQRRRVVPDQNEEDQDWSSWHEKAGEDLFCVHAYYGRRIRWCMEEIRDYLTQHKMEVVLLDFNHFYDMDYTDHVNLARCLKDVFGSLLCPYFPDISLQDVTLSKLCDNGTRVMIFYHEGFRRFPGECDTFWPGPTISSQSSWANTMDVEVWKQKQFLESWERHSGKTFYVCQGVLTPDTKIVANTFCYVLCCCCCPSGVQKECAGKINPFLPLWIRNDVQSETAKRHVIYTADFVEEGFDGVDFVQSVLQLNK